MTRPPQRRPDAAPDPGCLVDPVVEPALDPARCYDALASRDPRFDGRFWVGVRTTGVYCRPVCPSRTPKAANVAFYSHPAAAEASGFRPCRRCAPDAAPGSPAWRGGADVVDRALRLVEAGALDDGTVGALARRLAVGERHLRRLFAERVGTSPDVVARSRRAHLARRLLAETDLAVADVAFAAGFGSVRQCNDVVRATFGRTPTELRRDAAARRPAGAAPVSPEGDALALRLPVRAPFDPGSLLDWFAARAVPGLDVVDGHAVSRAVAVGGAVGVVRVAGGATTGTQPPAPAVRVEVDAALRPHLAAVVAGVRRWWDLDADPEAVDAHLGGDPLLAPLVAARPGLRVAGTWSGFEAAVRAVVGQQVSVAAARTVLSRIVAAHGAPVGPADPRPPGPVDRPARAFPGPDALVDEELEALGLFGRRAGTVRLLARAVLDGDLALDGAVPHADLVAGLVALPGVGDWTAEYVALRLGEPDAFPAGDLHLARVVSGGTSSRDVAATRDRAEAWRPWRSYAATHLWHAPRPPIPTETPT